MAKNRVREPESGMAERLDGAGAAANGGSMPVFMQVPQGMANAPIALVPVSAGVVSAQRGVLRTDGIQGAAMPAYAYVVQVAPGAAGFQTQPAAVAAAQPAEPEGEKPKPVRSRRCNYTGTLRLRGCTYWARWNYKGVSHERSTGIKADAPNARNKAMRKLEAFTAPYRLEHEREMQMYFSMKIKTLGEQALEAEMRERELHLGGLYTAFEQSPRRRTMRERTLANYEKLLAMLADEFGEEKLMSVITPFVASEYATALGKKVSNGTFNNYIACYAYVWDVLKLDSDEKCNPWRGICMKKSDVQVRQPLTDDELQNILIAAEGVADGEAKLLIKIAANTGMRISDCVNLKWGNVDFDARFIRRVKTIKTGAEISVPLLKELREALEELPRRGDGDTILRKLSDRELAGRTMDAVFRRAGIQTKVVRKKGERARPFKTFHSLRSTFVTKCAEAGISLEIVKAVVGHATVDMTEHYTHIREKAIKEAFDKAGLK